MGNIFGYNISAEDSIKELKFRQSLIKQYFSYSSSTNNFMGYKCCKIQIPGKEIKSDFTFYLYNIEGFFDIENGFFFTLHNLIWIMKCFNENKIDTKSYEDFNLKIKLFLSSLETIKYTFTEKNENLKNEKKTQDPKNKNNKNLEEFMEYMLKEKEWSKIVSYGISILRNCDFVINVLERIIPFDQFKDYISSVLLLIEGGCEIWSGFTDMVNLYRAMTSKNYFEAFIYLIDGTINFVQGGINIKDSYKQICENYRDKNFTKAQRNLNALLNKMDQLFNKLKENNLNKLYKNNIIVLAIDETNRFMKEPDIGFIYVEGIEYYAKSLDTIDINRNKFVMNMIIFYQQLKNLISSDEYNNNQDFRLRYGFMAYLKKIILKEYNQQLWNSMDEENISGLVEEKYKEYYDDYNDLNGSDDESGTDEQKKKTKITSSKNLNEITEKTTLTKSSSISSYSLNKKNENKKNNNYITKNSNIIEEEKKNYKNFYSTSTNGFYKKKIINKNTNYITPTTKPLLNKESNYCKIETEKNKYKISKSATYNSNGSRAKYKRRKENKKDEILSQELSLENAAPPIINYSKKINNCEKYFYI